MRQWLAVLDATCAWVNPGLVMIAFTLALLNLMVATQRWAAQHQWPPASVSKVVVTVSAEKRPPVLAPELRELRGRD